MWVRADWEKLGTLAGGGPLEGPSPWALRPLFNAQGSNPSWASSLHIEGEGTPILDMRKGGWELNRIPRALCCVLEAEVDTAVPLLQLSKEIGMTLHEGPIPPIQTKRAPPHTHTHILVQGLDSMQGAESSLDQLSLPQEVQQSQEKASVSGSPAQAAQQVSGEQGGS